MSLGFYSSAVVAAAAAAAAAGLLHAEAILIEFEGRLDILQMTRQRKE